ncbi:hypothetical protein RND81_12G056700 [Saponaria officinalis]|uniref:Retrotransposon gag domain-containing protein n=1 Tax=Saponaria officinalis TaxID=3572 RepID=A0AAW1H6R0_SAPOF
MEVNFLNWKRDACMALAAKNKEGFIDGTCKKPPKTDKKYHQWLRCDLMVMKWLLNSLHKSIRENFLYVTCAKDLWSELLERYEQFNALEVYQIRKDLSTVTKENTALIEYYSKMKRNWESLDSIDPIPQCSCGALDLCSCQLLKRMLDRENHTKLIQFLMGLNSAFDGVKTNILSMDTLPPINKAMSLLQRIERQKIISDAMDIVPEVTAYVAPALPQNSGTSDWKRQRIDGHSNDVTDTTKVCSFYHKKGHVQSDCYKLKHCSFCGRKGHVRDACFRLKGFPDSRTGRGRGRGTFRGGSNVYKRDAHNADVIAPDQATSITPLEEPLTDLPQSTPTSALLDSSVVNDIINSVKQQVMQAFSDQGQVVASTTFAGTITPLVCTVSRNNLENDLIIDTGASDHMTHDLALLRDVKLLPRPIRVGLPDGSLKYVHHIGTVVISPHIKLLNVLWVPNFKQNLLFVGMLIDHTNLCVLFYPHHCVFQDLSSKVTVGTGQRCGGL